MYVCMHISMYIIWSKDGKWLTRSLGTGKLDQDCNDIYYSDTEH